MLVTALMTITDPDILGLFPLDLVLLPGERVPLHIFEPRYRALVADCVLTPAEFVLPRVVEDAITRVACAARVESVTRRFADGRMNIVVRGTRRVQISLAEGDEPYLTGLVEDLPDEHDESDDAVRGRVAEAFNGYMAKVAAGRRAVTSMDVPYSYALAAQLPLDPSLKQFLVEERSETKRLVALLAVLDQALRALDESEGADEPTGDDGRTTVPE